MHKAIFLLLLFAFLGCTPSFNNHYDPLMLTCGIPSERFQDSRAYGVLQFTSPSGRLLTSDERSGLTVHLIGDNQQETSLSVSAAGCVLLPREKGVVVARQLAHAWSLVRFYTLAERTPLPQTTMLGSKRHQTIAIDCRDGRLAARERLDIGFSLRGMESPRDAALDVSLQSNSEQSVPLFRKPAAANLDTSILAVDLHTMPEGVYELHMKGSDVLGNTLPTETAAGCSVLIDRTPPNVREPIHTVKEALITIRAESIYPLEFQDTLSQKLRMRVCRQRITDSGPPEAHCRWDEDFHEESSLFLKEPGLWRVAFFAEDEAGNRTPTLIRDFRVEFLAPNLEMKWSEPLLNRPASVSVGRKRFHSVEFSLSDDVTSPQELTASLECRVELREPRTGKLWAGNSVRCASSQCRGKEMSSFIPCGMASQAGKVELTLDLSGSWKDYAGNLFILHARASDALGNTTSAFRSFWIQDDISFGWSQESVPENFVATTNFHFKTADGKPWLIGPTGVQEVTRGGLGATHHVPPPPGFDSLVAFHAAYEEYPVRCLSETQPPTLSLPDGAYLFPICSFIYKFDGREVSLFASLTPPGLSALQADLVIEKMHLDGTGRLWLFTRGEYFPDEDASRCTEATLRCLPQRGGWVSWKNGKWSVFRFAQEPEPKATAFRRVAGSDWAITDRGVAELRGDSWISKDVPSHFLTNDFSLYLNNPLILSQTNIRWLARNHLLHFNGTNWEATKYSDLLPNVVAQKLSGHSLIAAPKNDDFYLNLHAGQQPIVFAFVGGKWSCPTCNTIRETPSFDAFWAGISAAVMDSDGSEWVLTTEGLLHCSSSHCDSFSVGPWFSEGQEGPFLSLDEKGVLVQGWAQSGQAKVHFDRIKKRDFRYSRNDNHNPDNLFLSEKTQAPIEGQSADGREWRVLFNSSTADSQNLPAIAFLENGLWVPFSTPLGTDCRSGRFGSPAWGLQDFLSFSDDGTLQVVWCGMAQRLTDQGWKIMPASRASQDVTLFSASTATLDGMERVIAFHAESDDHYWINTDSGLFEFTSGSWRQIGSQPYPYLVRILRGADSRMWLGQAGALDLTLEEGTLKPLRTSVNQEMIWTWSNNKGEILGLNLERQERLRWNTITLQWESFP